MRGLLLIFMLLNVLGIYSQTDSLTVHVDGKPLTDLLTDEQKQNVNYLFITGTLADDDYAFLRGNNLPKLHELNLRKADIDTIPKKAFYGWDFYYDSFLCRNMAQYFKGCIPQYTCSAILPTIYGDVELYGHVDYINTNKIHDLKTTKNYTFGNYEKYWQRHLYPYCLIESGEMQEVTEFEFTVVKWKERKNEPISGEMYKEVYIYSHEASSKALRGICESFIEWLEANRDKITDKKIFAED